MPASSDGMPRRMLQTQPQRRCCCRTVPVTAPRTARSAPLPPVRYAIDGLGVVGSGYASPTTIRVAPGQITTFFVSGLSTDTTKPQKATTLPLPNSLAGISVTINQSSQKQSVAVPLLAVEQLNTCGIGSFPPPPPPAPAPTSPPSTIPPEYLLEAI